MNPLKNMIGWFSAQGRKAEAVLDPGIGNLPPEKQRRLRLTNWCILVMAVMLLFWVAANAALSAWVLAAWLGAFLLATVALLLLLRAGLSVSVASHLSCLLMVSIIVVSSVYSGGLTATMLTLFAVIPVGAVTAAGRNGAFWLAPTIAAVAAIYHLEVQGHVFVFLTPPEQRPLDAALTWSTSALIVTLLIFYYEVARRRAEGEMIEAMLQAEEASKIKTRFVSIFGHEVRTPLHGVLGMLALMKDEPSGEARKKMGEEARQEGEKLLAIISEVLETSRTGESRGAARPGPRAGPDLSPAATLPPFRREEKRVLVVEDDPVSRLLIVTLLGRMGLSVAEADCGREAMAMHSRGNFQLIFMDCQLPDQDGVEVTRLLRQREQMSGAEHVPIVAVSAQVTAEQQATCRMAGMDDFLPKPFGKEELEAMVRRWVF